MTQFRTAIANRQRFSPSDKRAITMFGREEFKPIMEGITIGIEALLFLIGAMTLGIGGVGVMNIMLVSVEERVREIGLRRALGARKKHIRWQFLLEALVMTIAAGAIGMLLSWGLTSAIGTLPFLGPAYEDESGKVDIHLTLSFMQRMDHRFLNYEVVELEGQIPTCENVARVIWNLLEPKIPQGRLHRVRLYESADLFADCYGNGARSAI